MCGEKVVEPSWDFRNSDTKYSTHGFHTYPAMMIPQVARGLITSYGKNASCILDPFMGSGTALVEATLHDNFTDAYGIDINPLALLLAKVKTTPIKIADLDKEMARLKERITRGKSDKKSIPSSDHLNIEFWFKPKVINELSIIKNGIDEISDKDLRDFFLVVFSETVRKVSNTRNNEYKLYRIDEEKLEKFNPSVFTEFFKKAESNAEEMRLYQKERTNCKVHILPEDSRNKTSIPEEEIDLIVTSPPYGDSRTTVAYGQFSRLALHWLGYDKESVISIDKRSLGGFPTKSLVDRLNSPSLSEVIDKISEKDEKRAREVLSFYVDFKECVKEFDRITNENAHLCFVVGNRTVKEIKIPTDDIMVELFQDCGDYKHLKTIIRQIPSKRLPKANSPTNEKGKMGSMMNEEYIFILEKR